MVKLIEKELTSYACEKNCLVLYFRKEAGYDTTIGWIELKIDDKFSLYTEEDIQKNKELENKLAKIEEARSIKFEQYTKEELHAWIHCFILDKVNRLKLRLHCPFCGELFPYRKRDCANCEIVECAGKKEVD